MRGLGLLRKGEKSQMGKIQNERLIQTDERVDSIDESIVKLHHAILHRAILDLFHKDFRSPNCRIDSIAWFITAPSESYTKRITVHSCLRIVEIEDCELITLVKRLFSRADVGILEVSRAAKYIENTWEEEVNVPMLKNIYGRSYF